MAGLAYLQELSAAELPAWRWLRDELRCERPVCFCTGGAPAEPATPVQVEGTAAPPIDLRRGTIPRTQLDEFRRTMPYYERAVALGLLVVSQHFCYDLTWMPLIALIAAYKICFKALTPAASRLLYPLRPKLSSFVPAQTPELRRFNSASEPCSLAASSSGEKKQKRVSALYTRLVSPGYALLNEAESAWRVIYCNSTQPLTATEISNLCTLIIFAFSFTCYNSLVSISAAYHFVRSQSLLKLYVIFNVLEVVDRMWRSLERDAMYEFMANVNGMFGTAATVELRAAPTECVARRQRGTDPAGRELFAQAALNLATCVLCVSSHVIMHLARGLLLCISMNSEPSAMFLLLFSNNWAEIKSTVFKKQTVATMFTLVAGDINERFQIMADAAFVYFQMRYAIRLTVAQSPVWILCKWIALMLGVEVFTDFLKYAFLVKYNRLSCTIFADFQNVMGFDFLVARSPTFLVTRRFRVRPPAAASTSDAMPVKLQGMAPFSRIAAERFGFQTVALLIFCLSSMSLKPLLSHPFLTLLLALLAWVAIQLFNALVSLALLIYYHHNAARIAAIPPHATSLVSQ